MAIRQRFLRVAASAMGVSVFGMALAFSRQLLIAAYFGVSRELELYLVVYSVANWGAFVFGVIFDSVAVPHLVRLRESGGAEASRGLAVKVFRLSCALGLAAGGLVAVAVPILSPVIATGFTLAERHELAGLAWYFLPWIFFCLPYYAAGARHKSEWRFNRVYLSEFVVGLVSVAALILLHDDIRELPLAYAAGYAAGLLWLIWGAGLIRLGPSRPPLRDVGRNVGELYVANQIGSVQGVVDRHFQSLIPPGGIAALGYSGQLIIGLSTLLVMREIFVVPLAEADGRTQKLERLLVGLLLVTVPISVGVACFAPEIVTIVFQRGRFDAAATALTAQVLRISAFTIILSVVNVPLARMFQILDRINVIQIYYGVSIVIGGGAAYFFVAVLGLGATGIAWASLVAGIPNLAVIAYLVARCGVAPRWSRLAGYLAYAGAAAAAAAVAGLAAETVFPTVWLQLLGGGGAYLAVVAVFYLPIAARMRRVFG